MPFSEEALWPLDKGHHHWVTSWGAGYLPMTSASGSGQAPWGGTGVSRGPEPCPRKFQAFDLPASQVVLELRGALTWRSLAGSKSSLSGQQGRPWFSQKVWSRGQMPPPSLSDHTRRAGVRRSN